MRFKNDSDKLQQHLLAIIDLGCKRVFSNEVAEHLQEKGLKVNKKGVGKLLRDNEHLLDKMEKIGGRYAFTLWELKEKQ